MLGLAVGAAVWAGREAFEEMRSSRWQAQYLARYAEGLRVRVEPGAAVALHPAPLGPYDQRLGYSRLPEFVTSLAAHGYMVTEQARESPQFQQLAQWGLFPPYREKDRAGLELSDCGQRPLYSARSRARLYEGFESIPPLLVRTLLFIEDRELLDAAAPLRNPAIDWTRLGRASLDQLWQLADPSHPAGGGSTLATQIEKDRHSPNGRTDTVTQKMRQMASASLRAYLDGESTVDARRRIVTSYLNTVPLAARAGYGEINGLGDGLWVWYGRDFGELNRVLHRDAAVEEVEPERSPVMAQAYKEVLSLMIAQRRPAYYLAEGVPALRTLTDTHLRLLAAAGVISPALRDAALPLPLRLQQSFVFAQPVSFVTRKASTALRTELTGLLGISRLYDLDRLDLRVTSTLNAPAQQAVSEALRALR
jgi:membrane peptidoglycan carboxypeptidase